jgi:hypothetical protein
MYEPSGSVTLKDGETVEAGTITGPDAEWAERIEQLLAHKGDRWNWQNSALLRQDVGMTGRFSILHRSGVPFANIMTAERNGAGIFGHVWTKPDDRRKGACEHLMRVSLAQFTSHGGRALFLHTGYDSAAYHIYSRHGFESVEPSSGAMDYYSTSREEFEEWYFAAGEMSVEPLDWPHWPASVALFMGGSPGIARCVQLGLVGRTSTESSLLPVVRREIAARERGEDPRVLALVSKETTAVTGLAAVGPHPLWSALCVVDIYCHPGAWGKADELLGGLRLPEDRMCVAYVEPSCAERKRVLEGVGFRPAGLLRARVPADAAKTAFIDVEVMERRP